MVLLGVCGAPGAQLIIASLLIDRAGWGDCRDYPGGEGKLCVPLLGTEKLDAFGLRGRRIHRDAQIAFDGIAAGFFVIVYPDGKTEGGRKKR